MATPIDATLDLNCWVLGDSHTCVFPVKISKSETDAVSSLKDVIKEKNPESFGYVDARSWVVGTSVSIDANLGEAVRDLATEEDILSSADELVSIFPEEPARKFLHVIIRSPGMCIRRVITGVTHLNEFTSSVSANGPPRRCHVRS